MRWLWVNKSSSSQGILQGAQWPLNLDHPSTSQYSTCSHYDLSFLNFRVINDPRTHVLCACKSFLLDLEDKWGQSPCINWNPHERKWQHTWGVFHRNLKYRNTAICGKYLVLCGNYADMISAELFRSNSFGKYSLPYLSSRNLQQNWLSKRIKGVLSSYWSKPVACSLCSCSQCMQKSTLKLFTL